VLRKLGPEDADHLRALEVGRGIDQGLERELDHPMRDAENTFVVGR
jgi:hypothetical protein